MKAKRQLTEGNKKKEVPRLDEAFDKAKTPSERQCKKEKILNSIRMANWDMRNSNAFKYLNEKLGGDTSLYNCRVLAQVIQAYTGIQLDREASRRKTVCIKWFDENLDVVKDFIDNHVELAF